MPDACFWVFQIQRFYLAVIVIACVPEIIPINGPVSWLMVMLYLPAFGSRHVNPHMPAHPYSRSLAITSFPLSSAITMRPLMSSKFM